jgi:hypothetical protein
MDMQQGQQNGHAAWTCSMVMQHGHSAWTYSMNMRPGHTVWTYSMDKQHGHAAGTCSVEIQPVLAASSCCMLRVHFYAACLYCSETLKYVLLMKTCEVYLVCQYTDVLLVRYFTGLAEVGSGTSANANLLTIYIHSANFSLVH